jgi:hypothetical protein
MWQSGNALVSKTSDGLKGLREFDSHRFRYEKTIYNICSMGRCNYNSWFIFNGVGVSMKLIPEKVPVRTDLRKKEIFFCTPEHPFDVNSKTQVILHTDIKENCCQNCGMILG